MRSVLRVVVGVVVGAIVGTVVFLIMIQGSFHQGYTDLDGLTFLNSGPTVNGSAGGGVAAQIDPSTGSLIDFNASAAAAATPNPAIRSSLG